VLHTHKPFTTRAAKRLVFSSVGLCNGGSRVCKRGGGRDETPGAEIEVRGSRREPASKAPKGGGVGCPERVSPSTPMEGYGKGELLYLPKNIFDFGSQNGDFGCIFFSSAACFTRKAVLLGSEDLLL